MPFRMHPTGLHYYDPNEDGELIFINTVVGNKIGYSQRQLKGAELARNLYISLVYPSGLDFNWIVISNQIKNCPVTTEDIKVAHAIWGKNINTLKAKTTRRKPQIVAGRTLRIPPEILNLYKEIYLTTDIFL